MKLFATSGAQSIWFGQSTRPHLFTCPVAGEYALLLVVGDEDITPDEQWELSEAVVRSGCRYAVCFGPTSTNVGRLDRHGGGDGRGRRAAQQVRYDDVARPSAD